MKMDKLSYYRIAGLERREEKGIFPDLRKVGTGFSFARKTLLLPQAKEVRLRDKDGVVDLRGITRKEIHSTALLIPEDWGGQWSSEAFFYLPRRGFDHGDTRLEDLPLKEIQPRSQKGSYRQWDHLVLLKFSRPFYFIPGREYSLLGEKAILLFHEKLIPGKRDFIQKALSDWKKDKDLFRQTIALRMAVLKWSFIPAEREEISLPGSLKKGNVLVNGDYWDKQKKTLVKELSIMGGKREKEISESYGPLLSPLLVETIEEGIICRKRGYLQRSDREAGKNISPFAAACLNKLEKQKGGLSPMTISPAEKEQYILMERMALLRMSDIWICSEEEYCQHRDSILKLLKEMGESEIGPLKDASGLSRRELLHILQWMEDEGEILNEDNRRRLADS